jgi:hypothetical protein
MLFLLIGVSYGMQHCRAPDKVKIFRMLWNYRQRNKRALYGRNR